MFTTRSEIGKIHWLRTMITLAFTVLAFAVGQAPLLAKLNSYAVLNSLSFEAAGKRIEDGGFGAVGIEPNMALFLILIPFVFALAALLLSVRFIHKRPVLSVLTARARFDVGRVGFAALIWFLAAIPIVFLLIPQEAMVYQFSVTRFLPLLGIALLLLPFQVAAEEVLFRGYILQTVSRFFARPIWPLLIVTVLFAAMHLSNPEFKQGFAAIAPAYFLLSFFLGVLTVLDNGLELPIGVHLGNNLFTAVVLSTSDGAMNTASVYQTTVAQLVDSLPIMLFALVGISLVILQVRYRFKWADIIKPTTS